MSETVSSIPFVAVLWEHAGFWGRRRILVQNTGNLLQQGFNDLTSAIGLHKGPSYTAVATALKYEPTVGFCEHTNYGGSELVLGWGHYPNIGHLFAFNDTISSVRFNPTKECFPRSATKPHDFPSIPLVVELYKDANFYGERVVLIEDVSQISSYSGTDWNDVITSVKVKKGPNYTAGKEVELDRDINFMGGGIRLGPGNYSNIGSSHGFNDVLSSVKFI